jgi:predicted AlkP superfamily pyrophosphatase or phosphodiesterase
MTALFLVSAFLCLLPYPCASAGPEVQKKVLILGIDGCRTDALQAAKAPNLQALIHEGAFFKRTLIVPERPTGADTISGPGWASILTGVWADKHGVRDNKFQGANFGQFPHFFSRLKKAKPKAYTASYVTWEPIHRYMVTAADDSQAMLRGKEPDWEGDARGTRKAIQLLKEGNPDALFIHMDHVDGIGHRHGFSPLVPEYLAAIAEVDERIGQIVQAVRGRKTYPHEDWLIIVCTDHGGKEKDHSGGHQVPEIRQVFLILNGRSVKRGSFEEPAFLVDVAATALTHLGVAIDPAWRLDGRPVGLEH